MKKILSALLLSFIFVSFVVAQNSGEPLTDNDVFVDNEGTTDAPQIYVDNIQVVNNEHKTGDVVTGNFSVFNAGLQTATDAGYRVNIVSVTYNEEGAMFPVDLFYSSEILPINPIQSGERQEQFSITIPNSLPSDTEFALEFLVYVGNDDVATERAPIKISGNLLDYVEFTDAKIQIGSSDFLLREGPTISTEEKINIVTNLVSVQNLTNVTANLKIFEGPNTQGENVYNADLETFDLKSNILTAKNFSLPTSFKAGVYTGILELKKDGQPISTLLETRYIIAGDDLKPKIGKISFNNADQNVIDRFVVNVTFDDVPINYRLDENGNFLDSRANNTSVKNIDSLTTEQKEDIPTEDIYPLPNNLSLDVAIFDVETNRILDTRTVSRLLNLSTDLEFPTIRNSDEIKILVNLKQNGEIIDSKEVQTEISKRTKGGWMFLDLLFSDPKFASVAGGVILVIIIAIMLLITFIKKHKDINNVIKK